MSPRFCAVCGVLLSPPSWRVCGPDCARERKRREAEAKRPRVPVRLVVGEEEDGGLVYDRLECGHRLRIGASKRQARACVECPRFRRVG